MCNSRRYLREKKNLIILASPNYRQVYMHVDAKRQCFTIAAKLVDMTQICNKTLESTPLLSILRKAPTHFLSELNRILTAKPFPFQADTDFSSLAC